MVAVTTYTSKGGSVSTTEADANFTNLNTGKVEEALSFPSIRPSLMLDFVNGLTLDPRITFTRASTATFVGSNGLIQTAAANVPRFDFDPVTLACRGWLLEPQRTNLSTQSQSLTGWANNGGGILVAQNVEVAPDGTTTAPRLSQSAATNATRALYSPGTASRSGQAMTTSFWIRKVSGVDAEPTIKVYGIGGGPSTTISAGFITSTWKRFTWTWTAINDGLTYEVGSIEIGWNINGAANDNVYSIWGFQVEAGSFATSYIPTAGSQVTRSGETGVMTGANFTSWYNYGEGTQYVEARSDFVIPGLIGFTNAGLGPEFYSNNQVNTWVFSYYRQTGTGLTANMQLSVKGDGAAYSGSDTGMGSTISGIANNYNDNTKFQKAASALKPGDSAFYWNTGYGTANVTNSVSAPMPRPTTLGFATNALLYAGFSGHIKKFEYYPRRLTNAQLQALTTI